MSTQPTQSAHIHAFADGPAGVVCASCEVRIVNFAEITAAQAPSGQSIPPGGGILHGLTEDDRG